MRERVTVVRLEQDLSLIYHRSSREAQATVGQARGHLGCQ